MTDRKKPGVAFWATVAVVVALVLYPLSYGPAFNAIFYAHFTPNERTEWLKIFYAPVTWLHYNGPSSVRRVFDWYVNRWR